MFSLRLGDGSINLLNRIFCRYPTLKANQKFKNAHPDMDLYTIYIADQASWRADKDVMDQLASTPEYSYNAYDMDALRESLMNCLGILKDVYITDELSEYVDYHTAKDDLKVTIKRPNGSTSVLKASEYEVVKKPKNKNEKTVQIKIKNGLEIDSVYTVSYNVAVSDIAKAAVDHTKNGTAFYGAGGRLGDQDTDHGSNQTSSNQPGFPSNKKATVTWSRHNNKGKLRNSL